VSAAGRLRPNGLPGQLEQDGCGRLTSFLQPPIVVCVTLLFLPREPGVRFAPAWWFPALLLVTLFSPLCTCAQEASCLATVNAGRTALFQNRLTESEHLFLEVLDEAGPCRFDAPRRAEALDGLAHVYTLQRRLSEAEPLRRRSVEIYQQLYGPDHYLTRGARTNLALLYRASHQYEQAEIFFRQEVEDAATRFGAGSAEVAASLKQLADLYVEEKKQSEAEPLYVRALALWQRAQGPEYPYVSDMLIRLAEISVYETKYAQAEEFYQQALEVYDRHIITDHVLPIMLEKYAATFRARGDDAKADALVARAKSLRAKLPKSPYLVY
jgi:Tetratricopeptide repeat